MEPLTLTVIILAGGLALYAIMNPAQAKLILTGGDTLTFPQLVSLAQNAGFSGGDEVTAAAIAMAESGGHPGNVGDKTIGRSIGLWQIYLPAHPEYNEQQLYDPQFNANAAYAIYSGRGNFSDWTAYNEGTYGKYLPNLAPEVMA